MIHNPADDVDISNVRALLLEIVRRAAYDWVSYRTNRRLLYKRIANDAYIWLFVEGPGHPDWIERERGGWGICSFLAICEACDIDPEMLRARIRILTPQKIQSMGRPPTHRHPQKPRPELEYIETSGRNVRESLQLLSGGELPNFE